MIAELVKGNRVTYFTVPRYKAMVEDIGADYREVRSALTKDGQADRDIATDMMAELPLRFLSEVRPPSSPSWKFCVRTSPML